MPSVIAPNTLVGNRYKVTRLLGSGGMKQVYLAEDTRLSNRLCAVAEMTDSFTDPKEKQAAAQSFAREADMLARLAHDRIVRVYDRLSEGNRHCLVMEYVEGETLEQRLGAAPAKHLDEKLVVDMALQVLDALQYLHAHNPPIVYRDLKPANVMLLPDGRVKLIDFGIARLFVPKKTGTMIGTQGYAPPEQYEGKAEPASDLYALGATMFHLLSGWDPAEHPPFMFPPLRTLRRDLDPALETLINEALTLDVNRRIGSAAEFRRRLENIKSPSAGLSAAPYAPPPPVYAPVNASGPGAPTVTGIVATQRCPRCARDIPADAVVCPYCSAQLKPVVILTPKRRRWPLAAAGLLVLAGAAFGGTYYYENVYLPRQAAIAQPKPKSAAEAAAPAQSETKTHEETQAAAAQRAQLMARLGEEVRRLQSTKPGSKAEQLAREGAITTALKITPPPEILAEAQALFDRAKADLTAASAADDYRRAANELSRALRMAPWDADGWMNLADADEGANDPGGAIVSLRVYLLAAPASASSASVGVRISELEQQAAQQRQQAEEQRKLAAQQRQQAEEQRKLAELKRQEEQQAAEKAKAQEEAAAAAQAEVQAREAAQEKARKEAEDTAREEADPAWRLCDKLANSTSLTLVVLSNQWLSGGSPRVTFADTEKLADGDEPWEQVVFCDMSDPGCEELHRFKEGSVYSMSFPPGGYQLRKIAGSSESPPLFNGSWLNDVCCWNPEGHPQAFGEPGNSRTSCVPGPGPAIDLNGQPIQ